MKHFLFQALLIVFFPLQVWGSYGIQYTLQEKQDNTFLQSDLKALGFSTYFIPEFDPNRASALIINEEQAIPLLEEIPKLGAFLPFNLHEYTQDQKSYIGYMKPKVMLKILGVEKPLVQKKFLKMFLPLEDAIKKRFGREKSYVDYDDLPLYPLQEYTFTSKSKKKRELFISQLKQKLSENQWLSLYKSYKLKGYEQYVTLSITSKNLTKNVFVDLPQAGIFSAISMYAYVKEGSSTIHLGMPKFDNIRAIMTAFKAKHINSIKNMDDGIIKMMQGLGSKPYVPEKIVWESFYEDAVERAQKEHKMVFVFMNQDGCGACEYLQQKSFIDREFVRIMNKYFIALALDIYDNEAPDSLQVKATPFLHILNSDGTKKIPTLRGAKPADKLIEYIQKALP